MINEVALVKDLLSGKCIDKKCLYRDCYLLAKWYKQSGCDHMEIRERIFEWAKENGIYITYNLNNIIRKAMNDKTRLKDNIVVRISGHDVVEIGRRFDGRNVRLLALALLCYAKANANRDGEFSISSVALGSWIGITNTNIIGRYLPELEDFGYIKKLESGKTFSWDSAEKYKQLHLKLLVPFTNDGAVQLEKNNIRALYDECF